jgi:uncharacterized protein (DUF433 family)
MALTSNVQLAVGRCLSYDSSMSGEFPRYIELRPNRDGQKRACIVGTRVRVQDIYVLAEIQGLSPDEIVGALPHLNLAQVHAALAYYFDNRDAILGEIREDEEFVSRVRAELGPGPLEQKIQRATTERGSISS